METIPSESVCYPAKLVHGHIESLIRSKVDFIFYPAVIYEKKEDASADNHFNCPVVASYPEVIRTNMDRLREQGIPLISPFLNIDHVPALKKHCKPRFLAFRQRNWRRRLTRGCKKQSGLAAISALKAKRR